MRTIEFSIKLVFDANINLLMFQSRINRDLFGNLPSPPKRTMDVLSNIQPKAFIIYTLLRLIHLRKQFQQNVRTKKQSLTYLKF